MIGVGDRGSPDAFRPLANLHALESVSIFSPFFTDASLEYLAALPNLRALHLAANVRLMPTITQFSRLETLRLEVCTLLEGAALASIAALPLEELDLRRMASITDADMQHLHGMQTLRRLRVDERISPRAFNALRSALPNAEVE